MRTTADFSTRPLWWNGTSLSDPDGDALPSKVDVLIVGSGFTGSSAALEVARSGRSVAVVEAQNLGFGSSSRNFGYIGGGIGKPRLAKRHPGERGEAMGRAYPDAADFVMQLLERESIDAEVRSEGLSILAHTPDIFVHLAKDADAPANRELGVEAFRSEEVFDNVIASRRFHGAVVNPDAKALNPGKYVDGMIKAARRHGAVFVPNAEALSIAGSPGNWTIRTNKGVVQAKQIGLGTNGHSGKLFQFLRKRIVPVVGTVIATEELDTDFVRSLFPKLTWFTDTQFGFLCFRPSPDHKRVVFAKAGLPGSFSGDPRPNAARVFKEMTATLPQLADVKIQHAWPGSVGVTFDGAPHLGVHEGVHFAAGYNGSGVAMASYLGYWMGRRLIGDTSNELVFEQAPFPTHFLYNGSTWFMPALRVLLNHLKLQV